MWRNASRWVPYAVSAIVLLGVGFWLVNRPGASVVATIEAQWSDGKSREAGAPVGREWLELAEGEVRLAFRDGAMVTLHGPAKFRAASASRGALDYGVLSAHVPQAATGFTVETPRANVVDLGTGFRLSVAERGDLQLHVTEGKVRLDQRQGPAESLSLDAGQVATVDPQGRVTVEDAPSVAGSPSVRFLSQHAPSLGYKAFVHDDQLFVFLESHRLRLSREVRLNLTQPGRHDQLTGRQGHAAAGELVSSYLVHCSPQRRRHIVEGTIKFPGKIIGVICDSDSLNATNSLLGAGWSLQCQHAERGLESSPDMNSDVVTISPDRRTLSLRLRTESIDQVRVLVSEE